MPVGRVKLKLSCACLMKRYDKRRMWKLKLKYRKIPCSTRNKLCLKNQNFTNMRTKKATKFVGKKLKSYRLNQTPHGLNPTYLL